MTISDQKRQQSISGEKIAKLKEQKRAKNGQIIACSKSDSLIFEISNMKQFKVPQAQFTKKNGSVIGGAKMCQKVPK